MASNFPTSDPGPSEVLPTSFTSADESDFDSCTTPNPVDPAAVSVLDKLRVPKKSDLSRVRKVQKNPPTGKKRSSGSSALKAKLKVHPSRRVQEFPGEELTVSFGKLFCNACREHLSIKSSTVRNHVSSQKHVDSKTKL